MRDSRRLLFLTAGVAICSWGATAFDAPTPVMATLAFAALACLGYVWITVILRGRGPTLELVSMAVGLVLAVPVVVGVVLDEAGIPLSRVAWSSVFVGLTLVGDVVLTFRYRDAKRVREYENEQPSPVQVEDSLGLTRPDLPRAPWGPSSEPNPQSTEEIAPRPRGNGNLRRRVSALQAGACGLAVLIAVGAIWVARAGAASQQYPGFTELWLSSDTHSASTDNLGVSNHEGKTEKYRLVLLRKGHVSETWDLTLTQGQTWQKTVQVTAVTRANLYIPPNLSQPYRYVDTEP